MIHWRVASETKTSELINPYLSQISDFQLAQNSGESGRIKTPTSIFNILESEIVFGDLPIDPYHMTQVWLTLIAAYVCRYTLLGRGASSPCVPTYCVASEERMSNDCGLQLKTWRGAFWGVTSYHPDCVVTPDCVTCFFCSFWKQIIPGSTLKKKATKFERKYSLQRKYTLSFF